MKSSILTVTLAALSPGCTQCSNPMSTVTPTLSAPISAGAPSASGSAAVAPEALEVTEPVTGKGAQADDGKTVSIVYQGSFPDGRVFDQRSDRGHPLTFKLGTHTVIVGLEAGMKGMRVGGRRRLVIPASMAYGSQGFGTVIPPGATLVFEVELLKAE